MTVQLTIAEAKILLAELVARAEAGEDVVIERDGAPVVRLTQLVSTPKPRRVAGAWKHLFPASYRSEDALDEDDPQDWGWIAEGPDPEEVVWGSQNTPTQP